MFIRRNNSTLNTQHPTPIQSGFTLVELMIVVSILGILAAIAMPEFQNYQQKAKEAQAKANLKILREAIERYNADHGVPPGYPSNNPNNMPSYVFVIIQLVNNKDYLSQLPRNPFNNHLAIQVLPNNSPITEDITYPKKGWIYHPATKTIKINMAGTDSEGRSFSEY